MTIPLFALLLTLNVEPCSSAPTTIVAKKVNPPGMMAMLRASGPELEALSLKVQESNRMEHLNGFLFQRLMLDQLRDGLRDHMTKMESLGCDMSTVRIEPVTIKLGSIETHYPAGTRSLLQAGISPCASFGVCSRDQYEWRKVTVTYRLHSGETLPDTEIANLITLIMKDPFPERQYTDGVLTKYK
jgi:hypothetical protein